MKSRLALSLLTVSSLTASALAAPPPNDKFAKATTIQPLAIGVSQTLSTSNAEATIEPGEPEVWAGRTVWFKYTAPESGLLKVKFHNATSGDGTLTVACYTGTSLKKLTPVDSKGYFFQAESVSDPEIGDYQTETFAVQKGVAYRLAFDDMGDESAGGEGSEGGNFSASFELVAGGGFSFVDAPSFLVTKEEEGEWVTGERVPQWRFKEGAGQVQIKVARQGGTEGVARVNYSISEGSALPGEDYSAEATGTLVFEPGVTVQSIPIEILPNADAPDEREFYISLEDPSTNTAVLNGDLKVYIEDANPQAPNDNFADAIALTGTSGTVTTAEATGSSETNEPDNSLRSVWYSFTAPENGLLDLSVASGELEDETSKLLVFLGDLAAPESVPHLADSVQIPRETITIPVSGGATYHIAVINQEYGGATLNYSFGERTAFRFMQKSYDFLEGEDSMIGVERVGKIAGEVSVHYELLAATEVDPQSGALPAKAGTAFTAASGDLTFEDNGWVEGIELNTPLLSKKDKLQYLLAKLSVSSNDLSIVGPTEARVFIVDAQNPINRNEIYFSGKWMGIYSGETPDDQAGSVQLTLAKGRGFTGTLILNGRKFTLKGAFPRMLAGENTAEVTVQPTGAPDDISVKLTLHKYADGSSDLTGSVIVEDDEVPFTALSIEKYTAASPVPNAGVYTMSLFGVNDLPADFTGYSALSVAVKPTGAFTLAGTLVDGTKVSGGGQVAEATQVQEDGVRIPEAPIYYLPVSVPLYSGKGALTGQLRVVFPGDLSRPPSSGDGDGELHWVHPPLPKGVVTYQFREFLIPTISQYRESKTRSILPALTSPGTFEFFASDGGLPESVLAEFDFTAPAKGKVVEDDPSKATITFNLKTGLFSGKFLEAPGAKALSYQGVVLQNDSTGAGYFLRTEEGTTEGGLILIGEPQQ